jgi:hypothetical protein
MMRCEYREGELFLVPSTKVGCYNIDYGDVRQPNA